MCVWVGDWRPLWGSTSGQLNGGREGIVTAGAAAKRDGWAHTKARTL